MPRQVSVDRSRFDFCHPRMQKSLPLANLQSVLQSVGCCPENLSSQFVVVVCVLKLVWESICW
jgi:hypothetical protein